MPAKQQPPIQQPLEDQQPLAPIQQPVQQQPLIGFQAMIAIMKVFYIYCTYMLKYTIYNDLQI
jgi:hypothetical protein